MPKKVLVVGGVAGGASAAARLRRLDEEARIIVFEKGEFVSYANCGLPYYIGGRIADRARLFVQTPAGMKSRFNIEVRTSSEVTAIDRERKQVRVKELESGREYDESYDKLVLSPGANAVRPRLPGIDLPEIFTLRDVPDTDRILAYVRERKPNSAVVVGGGFVGLEAAENLHGLGISVSVVEMAPQVMVMLDPEMAATLHNHLREKGVDLHLGDGVRSFEAVGEPGPSEGASPTAGGGGIALGLASGRRIQTDMVILAIGVKPDTTLAKSAGLKIGEGGGIAVDEYLATSDPDIYAVGDAIEVTDFTTGRSMTVPLAGPASKQGRIVADNICGKRQSYAGTQGTAIVKVFDLTVAVTGSSEKTLRGLGMTCLSSVIHPPSHAGFFPGSVPMALKLVFSPDGKVLGAQIVGRQGVDKRIDVLAAAIRFGGTVFDLQELELAYAPPYSSAKDAVNMAGFVGGNIVNGDVNVIQWHEIAGLEKGQSLLLDVREPAELRMGMVEGAVNIPLGQLRARLNELPKDKDIVVYCQVGQRGYVACRILTQHGFTRVRNLSGGWRTYSAAIRDSEHNKRAI